MPSSLSEAPGAELTLRSLIVGMLIGLLLTLTNLYMGLKTGWWESGNITATVLSFAFFAAASPKIAYTPLENNLSQTAAAAMGAMPATAGLLGAIPALAMAGHPLPTFGLIAWGAALGAFGAALALGLRHRLIAKENLPFPTGVATAELITAMHRSRLAALGRARIFLASTISAGIFAWLRDGRLAWIPSVSPFPGQILGIPNSSLTLGMNWSPMLIGVGFLMGLNSALSFVFGSGLAWASLAPLLVNRHLVESADYGALSGWLAWPGVGLIIGGSIPAVWEQRFVFVQGLRSIAFRRSAAASSHSPTSPPGSKVIQWVAGALVVLVGRAVFDVPVPLLLFALGLCVVFGALCARSAGQTDIAPLGQVGQLTQALTSVFSRLPATNIVAGSIAAGSAAQTVTLLGSLRTGEKLGASASSQFRAQLYGILAGALVMLPVYLLLIRAYGLASESLPAPFAVQWKTVGEVMAKGIEALPPYAAVGAGLALCLGLGLAWLGEALKQRWIPSPVSMGIAFIAPAHFGIAMCIGTLMLAWWRRWWKPADELAPAIAGGAIAGESLVGVGIALSGAFYS